MKENHFSLTAMMCAYMRAYHSKHVTPKIFNDFLAYSFIPEERRTLIEQGLVSSIRNHEHGKSVPDHADALAQVMQAMTGPPNVLSRSRYTEDSLAKAIRQGVKQYVILGAGFDTFAFRHPELVKQLQVFEVDHPATQTFKRHRLKELNWERPENLHFVPLDFTKESLATSLRRSSFDPQAKSFFSWLGVTMYLSQDEVLATLRAISEIASSSSKVIFDYLDMDAFVPEKVAPRVKGMLLMAQHAGEPMKSGLDPSTLAEKLEHSGLHLEENLTPANIEKRYFQGRMDEYYACEHVHFASAVVD